MNLQAAQLEVGPGKTYGSIKEAISSAAARDTLLIYQGNLQGRDH